MRLPARQVPWLAVSEMSVTGIGEVAVRWEAGGPFSITSLNRVLQLFSVPAGTIPGVLKFFQGVAEGGVEDV